MDDEWKLQAELSRIKRTVKTKFRQAKEKQTRCTPGQHSDGQAAAHQSLTEGHAVSSPQNNESSDSCGTEMAFREAQLLVHYLDYIFPLQYPYYQDQPALGGRGWLFWLLMKRGPLHQAVLTLSALHQHTQDANTSVDRESELIEYHTNALQRLRQVLRDCDMDRFAESREQMVEFLACGCALISFELFRAGLDNWQTHLHALTSVVNKILVSHPSTDTQKPTDGVDRAQPFLVTKVLWLDILASTATGMGPQTRYQKWLELDQIDMSRVMGCQNWVMKAIGDISTIAGRQSDTGPLKSDELQLKAIEQILEEGIERMRLCAENRPPWSYAITIVFATAALVQLQTLGSALKTHTGLHSGITFRGLAWPIATAGSVATADQQSFFEAAMQSVLDTSGPGFTNCGTVLEVLRRCWQYQEDNAGQVWTWQEGMRAMGICALLL
ncbi:hypothetical protein QQS21_005360 [Conoideocrella luteorostrata]|uniref:Uncharacterized protein n=1 Tax=Conoideocrella luteorostrata TaxID=1105319 RepID=A0AAJ0CS22_9HYPO|nr:hypothetical protein QQS21_005360 [Conoideocrella luteorostrata]